MDKIVASLVYNVAVCLVLCSVPAWTLSFTVEPSNHVVALGKSLMLNCQATHSGSIPVISWKKDDNWLMDPVKKPWRHLANNSLFYQSVSGQDVGKFKCGAAIIGTSNIIYSRVAEVQLAYITAVFVTPPSNQSVRAGAKSADLSCVTGRSLPSANVYWEKDGEMFTDGQEQLYKFPRSQLTSSSLSIPSITFVSSGWYRCVAVNPLLPHEPQRSPPAYLNVIPSRDIPHFQVQPKNLVAAEHADAIVQCVILGVPTPQVSWTHDGQHLQDTANRYVLGNGSLYFSAPINRSFAGQYVCTGRNSAGSISSSPILFSIAYFEFDFLENPKNTTATVRYMVMLKCHPPHSFPPQVTIHWYHNYQEIQQGSGMTIEQSTGTLSFSSIKKSDKGKYFCSGTNAVSQETRTSSIAYVTVNVPPSLQLWPRNSSVIQPQALVLDCKATGSPQPSLTWTKDRSPVDSSRVKILVNGSISINSTAVEDAGTYTCMARNVAGSAAASAHVTIHVRPSPSPSQVPKNATRTVGESVTFVCEFDGIPKPSVTWFYAGGQARVQVQASANYVLMSRSLEIRQVTEKDEGTYICEGKNSAGSSELSAYLKVQVPVSLDSGPVNVTVNESTTASFQCSASGDPKPTVTWYKGNNRLVTGGRVVIGVNSLTILQASRVDAGYYSCNVSNGLAFDTAAAFLLVQVVPNITAITVPRLVDLGDNATLSCSATGIPAPRVTWQMRGVVLGGPRVVMSGGGKVELIDVKRVDNGSYTCVAENDAGRDTKSGEITVQVPPSPPVFLSAIPVSSTAITVSWKPGFDGYSPITGYSVSARRGNGSYSQVLHQSLTTYRADSLAPYEVYTFRVVAWNKIGQGEVAVVQNRTLEAAPSVPQSMSTVSSNATTIQIRWGTPKYPNGVVTWYKIQYKRSDNDSIKGWELPANSLRQAVVGGLAAYTFYVFSVHAATGQQPKLWGNFTTRIERTKEAAPSATPQNVQVFPLSSESINVTWKAVSVGSRNGVIREYRIHYQPMGPYHFGNISMITVKGNGTFNYALRRLHPWTDYRVAVQAVTVKPGPKSGWIINRTQEAAPAGPPTSVKLTPEDENSIKVLMTYPEKHLRNGIIRGFTVYYKETGPWTFVQSSNTSVRLVNLKVYTKYVIKVSAFTSVGEGFNSSAKESRTKEGVPGPVQGLNSRAHSYDTITVSWKVPKEKNGKIQNYMVSYKSRDGKSLGSMTTIQLYVKFKNLSPNTTFLVWVRARTSKGYGDVATGNSTTSIPSVTLSAGPYGIITVTWKPLRASQEAQYLVHFKPTSSNNVTTVTSGDVMVQLKNLTTHMNYTIWVMNVSTDGEEAFITSLTATTYVLTPSTTSPPTVAATGERSGPMTERDLVVVIVCVSVIVILLLIAAVYFVAIRPRTSQGNMPSRKGRKRLRTPELELQGGGGQRNAGFDEREDVSTVDTEDSFGSFDVDDWPSTITGQQGSEQRPQYAVGRTGSKKSPLVELRSKQLSVGSQDSFYDQPYTSLEELGASFTSFGPPPPPAFRSTTADTSDTDSSKTLPIDFPNSNRLSFTHLLYPAAKEAQADLDPDEELDKELGSSGAAINDEGGVHGIENKGVRSDSAEPPKPDGAEGNSGELPIYAKPDKKKKGKYGKLTEGDDQSTVTSASSYHLVDESGKAVHDPVVVYDERTNL